MSASCRYLAKGYVSVAPLLAVLACSGHTAPAGDAGPAEVPMFQAHVGNIVRIRGQPGSVDFVSGGRTIPGLALSLDGNAVVPVPPLLGAVEVRRAGQPILRLKVTWATTTAPPGSLALSFLGALAAISDDDFPPPSDDPAARATHSVVSEHFHELIGKLRNLVATAQNSPVHLGTVEDGTTIELDSDGLRRLDEVIAGIEEPILGPEAADAQAAALLPAALVGPVVYTVVVGVGVLVYQRYYTERTDQEVFSVIGVITSSLGNFAKTTDARVSNLARRIDEVVDSAGGYFSETTATVTGWLSTGDASEEAEAVASDAMVTPGSGACSLDQVASGDTSSCVCPAFAQCGSACCAPGTACCRATAANPVDRCATSANSCDGPMDGGLDREVSSDQPSPGDVAVNDIANGEDRSGGVTGDGSSLVDASCTDPCPQGYSCQVCAGSRYCNPNDASAIDYTQCLRCGNSEQRTPMGWFCCGGSACGSAQVCLDCGNYQTCAEPGSTCCDDRATTGQGYCDSSANCQQCTGSSMCVTNGYMCCGSSFITADQVCCANQPCASGQICLDCGGSQFCADAGTTCCGGDSPCPQGDTCLSCGGIGWCYLPGVAVTCCNGRPCEAPYKCQSCGGLQVCMQDCPADHPVCMACTDQTSGQNNPTCLATPDAATASCCGSAVCCNGQSCP